MKKSKTIIEVGEEYTKISGTQEELLASISFLLHSLKEKIDEDAIRFAVELGLCDKDKRNDVMLDAIKEKLQKELKELLDNIDKEDEKDTDTLLEKLRKKYNK